MAQYTAADIVFFNGSQGNYSLPLTKVTTFTKAGSDDHAVTLNVLIDSKTSLSVVSYAFYAGLFNFNETISQPAKRHDTKRHVHAGLDTKGTKPQRVFHTRRRYKP